MPVDREGRAGQRRGAQRTLVHPVAGVAEARGVAAEHLDIGHQVVAEGDGLGRLQVGEARHQGVGVGFGLGQQCALKGLELPRRAVARLPHPEPKVERHLVVARARRMQPPRRLADQLTQPGLHVHVDVLELLPVGEGPGLDLGLDGVQAPEDRRLVIGGDDADLGQHLGMRPRAGQVLAGQPPVEAYGNVDRLHQLVGLA